MPLTIFKRSETGAIQTDAAGKEQYEQLPLKNEMAAEDFCVPGDMFGKVGLQHAWLQANFDQRVLWVPEDRDFDDFKTELAGFLNKEISGPYFVIEGFVNTRWTLSIALLEPADIKAFAARYPAWQADANAAAENAQTLAKWQEVGRNLNNQTLYNYACK